MATEHDETVARIKALVRDVQSGEMEFGQLSTGEQIAVALITDTPDRLPNGYRTILSAVDRLGDDWLKAAIEVHKSYR